MSLRNTLSELEREHQAVKCEIQNEAFYPGAHGFKLAALKRRKLQLKDEMEKLRRAKQRSVH